MQIQWALRSCSGLEEHHNCTALLRSHSSTAGHCAGWSPAVNSLIMRALVAYCRGSAQKILHRACTLSTAE